MRVARRFTEAGKDVYQALEFRTTRSEIRNPDGSVVFQAEDIEVAEARHLISPPSRRRKRSVASQGVPAGKPSPDTPGRKVPPVTP